MTVPTPRTASDQRLTYCNAGVPKNNDLMFIDIRNVFIEQVEGDTGCGWTNNHPTKNQPFNSRKRKPTWSRCTFKFWQAVHL